MVLETKSYYIYLSRITKTQLKRHCSGGVEELSFQFQFFYISTDQIQLIFRFP